MTLTNTMVGANDQSDNIHNRIAIIENQIRSLDSTVDKATITNMVVNGIANEIGNRIREQQQEIDGIKEQLNKLLVMVTGVPTDADDIKMRMLAMEERLRTIENGGPGKGDSEAQQQVQHSLRPTPDMGPPTVVGPPTDTWPTWAEMGQSQPQQRHHKQRCHHRRGSREHVNTNIEYTSREPANSVSNTEYNNTNTVTAACNNQDWHNNANDDGNNNWYWYGKGATAGATLRSYDMPRGVKYATNSNNTQRNIPKEEQEESNPNTKRKKQAKPRKGRPRHA